MIRAASSTCIETRQNDVADACPDTAIQNDPAIPPKRQLANRLNASNARTIPPPLTHDPVLRSGGHQVRAPKNPGILGMPGTWAKLSRPATRGVEVQRFIGRIRRDAFCGAAPGATPTSAARIPPRAGSLNIRVIRRRLGPRVAATLLAFGGNSLTATWRLFDQWRVEDYRGRTEHRPPALSQDAALAVLLDARSDADGLAIARIP